MLNYDAVFFYDEIVKALTVKARFVIAYPIILQKPCLTFRICFGKSSD